MLKKFRIKKKRIIKDLYVRKLAEDLYFRKLINDFKQDQDRQELAYEYAQGMRLASYWKF